MCRTPQADSKYEARTLNVHIAAGALNTTVNLGRKWEDIVEVHLDEYAVFYAAAAPPNPNILYVQLEHPFDVDVDNSDGIKGFPLVLSKAGNNEAVHVVYNEPRVVSRAPVQAVTTFNVRIQQDDNTVPVFTDLLLMFTVIIKRRVFRTDVVEREMLLAQRTGLGRNDWRSESVQREANRNTMSDIAQMMFSSDT